MIFSASFSSSKRKTEPELVEYEDVSGCADIERGTMKATFLAYNGRYFINTKTGNVVSPEEFEQLDLIYVPARDGSKTVEISMLEFIPETTDVGVPSGSGS